MVNKIIKLREEMIKYAGHTEATLSEVDDVIDLCRATLSERRCSLMYRK